MSEQGKTKNRSRASDAPRRRSARSEDELRIYGDGESSAARARRRNEKTPPRARRGRPGRRGSRPKGLAGLYAWLIEARRDGAGKGLRIFGLRVNLPALIVSVLILLLVSVTFLENRNLNVDEETVTIFPAKPFRPAVLF